jgi:hypothetical protein
MQLGDIRMSHTSVVHDHVGYTNRLLLAENGAADVMAAASDVVGELTGSTSNSKLIH